MGKFYASKVIETALGEVGYLEKASKKNLDDKTANAGKNNYTKYARDLDAIPGFYNGKKNGYAWCDMFVDWCFVTTFGVEDGLRLLCQPKKSGGAGVGNSRTYYKNKKQFHTKNPLPGDQIFFWMSDKKSLAHTGLVYAVDKTYVYTVEGNTSGASGVVANGGGVNKKKYKLSYWRIYGYGRPAYDPEPEVEVKEAVEKDPIVSKVATESAKNFSADLVGTYETTAKNLNVRNGAGTSKKKMISIPKGTKVQCYGYYNLVGKRKWLHIKFTYKNVTYTGYSSSTYLKLTGDPKPAVEVVATDKAQNFLADLAGTYETTAKNLNVRNGAGTSKKKLVSIPKGTKVECHGYYNLVGTRKWLYIKFTYKNVTYTGFSSSTYLKKR